MDGAGKTNGTATATPNGTPNGIPNGPNGIPNGTATPNGSNGSATELSFDTDKQLKISMSRYWLNWMEENGAALIVCCYKSNVVFALGAVRDNVNKARLSFFTSRQHHRPLGATYDAQRKRLFIGEALTLQQFNDEGTHPSDQEGVPDYDVNFVPRRFDVINDIDIHDIVVDAEGDPYFCSALFSCVCKVDNQGSFKVFWKPDWITKIAAEDRCHMNGLCCRDGVPRYVSCVSRTDVRGAWREHRREGGVIYDIVENRLVCKGLSMPHSPRWHNGKLWVLDSGTGQFGFVEFGITTQDDNGESYHPFVPCCFIPGFIRGLTFVKNRYAVIGSSDDRHDAAFSGLKLGEVLSKQGLTKGKCGIFVVDLDRMDALHCLTFDTEVTELYDVTAIHNCQRPRIALLDASLAMEFRVIEED